MKIAIISDIHNNLTNLKKVLDYCKSNNIEKIICCGDLASLETLDFLNDDFSGEILYTFGNMDDGHLKNVTLNDTYKKTRIWKKFGETEVEGRKIAFVHYPKAAKELAQTGKYDLVFHGHTHKPWIEKFDHCLVLCPGNVAGEIFPPTFAVWNTENEKFDLIRIQEL